MQHANLEVDKLHLEDLNNKLHSSIFDENDDYNMLIVRLPIIQKNLEVISLGFIITGNSSYLYNLTKKGFDS